MFSRMAFVDITLAGVNITADLDPDTTGFSYTDNSGENESEFIDEISLTVQNRTKKWLYDWFPVKGDTITAKIVTSNWLGELDCGEFVVDDIDYSGYPLVMNLKALSVPMSGDFSDNKKSDTWNKATLSEVAQSVGEKNGIPVEYEADYDPVIDFVSQTKMSDKNFLHTELKKYGLTLKLFSNKIVIYDMSEAEKESPNLVITENEIISFSAHTTIANTAYTSADVKYTDKTGELVTYTKEIENDNASEEKKYTHNSRVKSVEEAERVATSVLREKNMEETTFDFSKPGDPRFISGITYEVKGFGRFDGIYLIDKAEHSLQGGYTVNVSSHKVMNYD